MANSAQMAALAVSWEDALERSGFWKLLAGSHEKCPRIIVLLQLGGSRKDDPHIISPRRVESLIDLIHQRTAVIPVLAASSDETSLWAGNRDVYALAELMGYRFATNGGLEYDLLDLSDNLTEAPFPEGSSLHGSQISADWLQAGIRLNLACLRPDAGECYAAGLFNLLSCLPLVDKALHYRQRRHVDAVISDILCHCPPHHTLIDAGCYTLSDQQDEHDHSGSRFAVASHSALLADYTAALKVGLDPHLSHLVEAVAASNPLPSDFAIDGLLDPIETTFPHQPMAQMSTRYRRHSDSGDRLLEAWLTPLDPMIFPAKLTIDAKAGEVAADIRGSNSSPSADALVTAINLMIGFCGQSVQSWCTLFNKDGLIQEIVSLGIDPEAIQRSQYDAIADELEALLPIAEAAPERAPGLRWRKFEKAVLFHYSRTLAIPFDLFVEKVDVSRTIEFMNDYIGGVMVVLDRDNADRPVRQCERNLYLPQPNYLVLYGGKPIDVTKIETVRYEPDAQRLYWKTICSSNGSADADDGVACFERHGAGTRITIAGKQRFNLPPAMQLVDLSLLPQLDVMLTTQAYQHFFERTTANFEALVEGRSIKIGRNPDDATPHPSIQLQEWMASLAERAGPWMTQINGNGNTPTAPDDNGFVHVVPQR